MAFDAGEVFVKLSGLFVRDEFDKWDRAVDRERAKADTPIDAKLGADSSRLVSDLAQARGQLDAFGATTTEAEVGIDEGYFGRALARASLLLNSWIGANSKSVRIGVDLDIGPAQAKLALLAAEIRALSGESVGIGGSSAGVLPAAAERLALPPAGGTTPLALMGVRGSQNVGSANNPLVTTLEAGSIAGLASRAAQIGYDTGAQAQASQGGDSGDQPTTDPVIVRILDRLVTNERERAQLPVSSETHGGFTMPYRTDPYISARRADPAMNPYAAGWSRFFDNIDAAAAEMKAAAGGGGSRGGGGGGTTIITGGGGDGGQGGGGGGGGGGGFGNTVGNFLFGAGMGIGGRRWGPLNPFRYGIHGPLGAVGGAVGLGPEHLVSAAGSVIGSGIGALGGAGVVALGALGQMAVGGGSDLAVMKSTISDTQQLSKGMEAVSQAVTRYGKNSTQAAQAQAQLNVLMESLGNTAGVRAEAGLARAARALNVFWDQATSNARIQAVHILTQVVDLGTAYVPKVAHAAEQNLAIINTGLKPLFLWLKGPEGMGIFDHLEERFKQNLPHAIDAFVNGVEALLKTVNAASDFTGHFTATLDKLARRWNDMPADVLHAKLAHLVDDFRLWEDMVKNLIKDLYYLFKSGSGEGNDLIVMLDNLLKRWGAWETSARGQSFLHTFFRDRKNEMEAILSILGAVLHMYGQFYIALQPLVPAVTMFARVIAQALGDLSKLIQPVAGLLGDILKFFARLGHESSIFKDAFLAPLGAFLVTWKLFGRDSAVSLFNLSSHLRRVGELASGLSAAVKAIFAGEGLGAAWEKLKGAFSTKTPSSPAAQMEEAMISGGKAAAEEIKLAMASGGKVAAEEVEAGEIAGGKVAGVEEGAGTGLGAASAAAGGARAAEGGLLSRVFGSGAMRLFGAAAIATIGTGVFSQIVQSSQNRRTATVQQRTQIPAEVLQQLTTPTNAKGWDIMSPVRTNLPWAQQGNILVNQAQQALSHNSTKELDAVIKRAEDLRKIFPQMAGPINQFIAALRKVDPAAIQANKALHELTPRQREWDDRFNQAWKAVNKFAVQGGDSIKSLRDRFQTNMRLIENTVGTYSDAGQNLAQRNFDKLVAHVEDAMRKGKISVKDGMTFMRNIANQNGQRMQDDLYGHFQDILKTIDQSWKKGNTDTQDALNAARQIYKDTNDKIRADVQSHYQKMLDDARKQHDAGLLTDQQYSDKRTSIHQKMAKAIAGAELQLSKSSAGIIDGLNTATASGMDQLFKELNKALQSLNVKQVNWGVSHVSNVVGQGVAKLGSLIPFVTTGGGSSGITHGKFAGGGVIPGASMWGLGDNMTLVDPMGRPVAQMAGDEAIFNRHQMPYVDMGLRAIGFRGADDLWTKVNTPHNYEKGGKLVRRYAGGGIVTASEFGGPGDPGTGSTGYRGDNLYAHPDSFAELNMGTALGGLPYMAPIDVTYHGNTARLYKRDIGAGGPGLGGRPRAVDLWFQAAQALRFSGLDNILVNGPQGVNVRISGGGATGAAPVLTAPHVTGLTGPLANLANGALGRVANAANQYIAAHMPAPTGGPAGTWTGGVVAGRASKPSNYFFPFPKGMNFTWQRIDQGQDLEEQPGAPVLAIAPGMVSSASDRFGGFGPYYATEQITSGPLAGRGVYYGHTKVVKTGPVNAGDVIAVTQSAANTWTAAPAGWLELGFLPYGSMSAGNAIAPILHAIYSGNYASGGRLRRFAFGGRIAHDMRHISGSPKIGLEKPLDHPAGGIVQFGYTLGELRRRSGIFGQNFAGGGWLGAIPRFARGGGSKKYSLYTPTKPRTTSTRRKKAPSQHRLSKPPLLVRFLDSVPGLTQFSQDDATLAGLEDKYNRQEQIFGLSDPNGMSVQDLDTLVGIRIKEWNILDNEYNILPGFADKLRKTLYGHPSPGSVHQSATSPNWHFGMSSREGSLFQPWASDTGGGNTKVSWMGGINQTLGRLTGQVNATENLITHLNDELYRDQQRAAINKHSITAASLKAAEQEVVQLAPIYDKILGNVQRAIGYTDNIASLPQPVVLGYLMGNAYGQAQARNYATAQQRRLLSAARSKILEHNNGLYAEIGKIMQRKQQLALQYRQQGFDAAWVYQQERYAIGWRVRKLREHLKELKKKLAQEKTLAKDYQGAVQAIDTRLHGGGPNDPGGESVLQQLGDIGFDILSLHQQGADVPSSLLSQIMGVMTKLGIQVPPGLLSSTPGGTASATATAAAAWQEFMNFQNDRANMLSQFGSNFVPAGSSAFAGTAGVAAGVQFYGGAAGAGSGVPAGFASGGYLGGQAPPDRGGDTIFNIEQHFGTAPDPHTWSAGIRHELGALV